MNVKISVCVCEREREKGSKKANKIMLEMRNITRIFSKMAFVSGIIVE